MLLLGDPGRGKTACAVEASIAFESAATSVHHAWCRTWPGGPEYWPWIQWLRSLRREAKLSKARAQDPILDDCLDRLWSDGDALLAEGPDAAHGTHRFRLFDAVTSRLEKRSDKSPLALFLDDLDAAPDASLELIEFVLRQLAGARLLIVASIRSIELCNGAPLVARLKEWMRHIQCTRIFLAPLGTRDVRNWLDDAGIDSATADARDIAEKTAGNPLWIDQWLAALSAPRSGRPANGTPRVVVDLAATRLAQLETEVRAVLRAAATLGRFDVGELAQVAQLGETAVERALTQARDRYVVSRTREDDSCFEFSTPLYGGILRSEAERERATQVQRGIPQDSPARAQVRLAPGL